MWFSFFLVPQKATSLCALFPDIPGLRPSCIPCSTSPRSPLGSVCLLFKHYCSALPWHMPVLKRKTSNFLMALGNLPHTYRDSSTSFMCIRMPLFLPSKLTHAYHVLDAQLIQLPFCLVLPHFFRVCPSILSILGAPNYPCCYEYLLSGDSSICPT